MRRLNPNVEIAIVLIVLFTFGWIAYVTHRIFSLIVSG